MNLPAPTQAVSYAESGAGVYVNAAELWRAAVAATLIPLGLIWDFSWENTIGVDRFWSPPHLTINLGVWLVGALGLWLVVKFSKGDRRNFAIGIGPFAAPAGAWIILWGAALFQLALPLDNWWQQAYGLGAGLWHPPQIMKAVSFVTIFIGTMALSSPVAPRFFTWHSGLLLTMCAIFLTADSYANWQHAAWFYKVSAIAYPAALFCSGAASKRWGATWSALIYSALDCAMVWILPLFPGTPLTAPIHNSTNHMLPPAFPLLLIFPAMILDFIRERWRMTGMKLAVIGGVAFVGVFVFSQWFFAEFLLSSDADNWFFAGGGKHWPYFLKIDQARVLFWNAKQDPLTVSAVVLAMLFAIVSSWIGLQLIWWLSKLRR